MTGSGGPRPARTRWRRTLLAVAALVTGGVALQLVVAAPALPATRPAGQLAQGRELYMRSCAWCHGQRGEGSGYGPSLVGVGAASVDFQLTTGRMPLDSEDRTPQREPPAFTPDQIDALVV